jgi:hypothetical protein
MSAELVGPVPVITFADGTRQPYDVPRNTLDIRYAACTDHHPACDCREALQAENLSEYRGDAKAVEAAFAAELQDHATWPTWYSGDPDAQFQVCQCSGCRIARRVRWVRSPWDTDKDRRACRPDPEVEVPF